jgi:hypothetical protein
MRIVKKSFHDLAAVADVQMQQKSFLITKAAPGLNLRGAAYD